MIDSEFTHQSFPRSLTICDFMKTYLLLCSWYFDRSIQKSQGYWFFTYRCDLVKRQHHFVVWSHSGKKQNSEKMRISEIRLEFSSKFRKKYLAEMPNKSRGDFLLCTLCRCVDTEPIKWQHKLLNVSATYVERISWKVQICWYMEILYHRLWTLLAYMLIASPGVHWITCEILRYVTPHS